MNRLRSVLRASALVPILAYAAPAQALTLREALAIAYATNPQIEGARANLRATDEEIAKARAGWRPSLNLDGTEGFQHIITDEPARSEADRNLVNGRAVLSEPLYRGGRTVADIRRANAQVRAARAELLDAEQNILLAGATAYMDVVRDTANLESRRRNVRALQDQFNASNIQLRAGAITLTDLQQTQARLAVAQASATSAEGQLGISRSRFERLIGRPPEMLENSPVLPPAPAGLEQAVSLARGASPALLAAQENSRAADYAIDQATSALRPQLSLSLQYQYAKNSTVIGVLSPGVTQREASVFLQLRVPLYQGGAEYAQVRQVKEQRSQALANVAEVERRARETAESAYANFTAAQAAIASIELAVQANQTAVRGVIEEQRGGERSILDILNAQQELVSSEIGLANARRDASVAALELLAATGQLTAASLALDVPLYDPVAHYNRSSGAWFGGSIDPPREAAEPQEDNPESPAMPPVVRGQPVPGRPGVTSGRP
jgi:outer membrane protein